jgi:hypothetical protein
MREGTYHPISQLYNPIKISEVTYFWDKAREGEDYHSIHWFINRSYHTIPHAMPGLILIQKKTDLVWSPVPYVCICMRSPQIPPILYHPNPQTPFPSYPMNVCPDPLILALLIWERAWLCVCVCVCVSVKYNNKRIPICTRTTDQTSNAYRKRKAKAKVFDVSNAVLRGRKHALDRS